MYSIAVIQWDFSLGGRNAMLRAYSLNGRTLSPFVALAAGRFTGVVETVFLWGSFTLYVIILLINTCVCVRASRLYRVLLLHSNARLSACQPAPLLPSPPPCVYNSYSSPPSLFCIAHILHRPSLRRTFAFISWVFFLHLFDKDEGAEAWAYRLSKVGIREATRMERRAELWDVVLSSTARAKKRVRDESAAARKSQAEAEAIAAGSATPPPDAKTKAWGCLTKIVNGKEVAKKGCCRLTRKSRRQSISIMWRIIDLLLILTLHSVWVWWLFLASKSGELETVSLKCYVAVTMLPLHFLRILLTI